MLLAVDIGNSGIKFGVFDANDSSVVKYRFSISSKVSRTADEYELLIRQFLSIHNLCNVNHCVIASVAPSITNSIYNAVRNICSEAPFIIGSGTHTGFKIRIDDPSELGADIVSNAAAALSLANGPSVVADLGTATTLTAINRNAELIGSVIIPGAGLSLDALSDTAELLNKVSFKRPKNLIGTNSADSITSGVINGNIFMIDGFIRNLREQLCAEGEKLALIATGGYCNAIIPHCRNKFQIVDDLTLIGASLLYRRNKK